MKTFASLAARLIRASNVLDRAYHRLDRARALLVTAYASDAVLAAYNDIAYGTTPTYDAGTAQFREKLFNWEADLVRQVFPGPPSRVLVGGAGGGREAFQLAAMGYTVTAFEPSPALAASMRDRAAQTGAAVEALLGRYEEMPLLRHVGSGEPRDLSGDRFSAALIGWSSLSHLRDAAARIATLRAFADVTDGPVAASFFLRRPAASRPHRARKFLGTLGRRREGDSFTPNIGFFHFSSREELAGEVAAAGLAIVAASYDETDGHWPWIAVARPEVAARLAGESPAS